MIFKKRGTGALEDLRHHTLQEEDYLHEEVAFASPVVWEEKTTWRHYPVKDQSTSSSCVANATALILGIENEIEEGGYVELSARDIYSQRMNCPAEGMYFWDALDIAKKNGATLEVCIPSNGKKEAEMNTCSRKVSDRQVANIFKSGGYVGLPVDIDAVADVLDKGKGILAGFKFNYPEWQQIPVTTVDNPTLHHGVAIVDYTLYKGQKCLIMQDSWGLDKTTLNGQRIITEDFFKKRCTFVGYMLDLSNDPAKRGNKPVFDGSVKSLQDCLRYEGLFPTTVESTGVFGAITKKALIEFQKKYGIEPAVGFFGEKTKAKLLELYK
jgi:hypothetical protein